MERLWTAVLGTETNANKIARTKVKIILSVEERRIPVRVRGKCSNGEGRIERDFNIKFNKHVYEVLNKNNNVIATAKPINNIYKLVIKEPRTFKLLELIHADVCGPMEHASIGDSKYFIFFIDDYSRRLNIYFLKNKNEALDVFKIYKVYIFVGYLENTKGYRLYDESTQKVFKSRDVVFYEDKILYTKDFCSRF
ncbi:POLX protein, partial [Pseudoatta argentina]